MAGEHWGVDAIIHFGHACLTQSIGRVPSCYLFGNVLCPVVDDNTSEIVRDVIEYLPSNDKACLFAYDFRFAQTAHKLAAALSDIAVDVWFSNPYYPSSKALDSSLYFAHAGRLFKRSSRTSIPQSLVYLGDCDSSFYRILVSLNEAYKVTAITVDPSTAKVAQATKSASSILKRRFYMIERAREAKRIGILVGLIEFLWSLRIQLILLSPNTLVLLICYVSTISASSTYLYSRYTSIILLEMSHALLSIVKEPRNSSGAVSTIFLLVNHI